MTFTAHAIAERLANFVRDLDLTITAAACKGVRHMGWASAERKERGCGQDLPQGEADLQRERCARIPRVVLSGVPEHQGCACGALRLVSVSGRQSEYGEHIRADSTICRAAELLDDMLHAFLESACDGVNVFRVERRFQLEQSFEACNEHDCISQLRPGIELRLTGIVDFGCRARVF